jgi:hypothetical protein
VNAARDTHAWVINGDLTLVALGGTAHSVTAAGDRSVRIVQPVGAGDFTVDTNYKSQLSANNVWQGVSFDLGGRTLLQAMRHVSGADYVQVTLFDASGAHLLSSERVTASGTWNPVFRDVRAGNNIALSWSVDGSAFSTPVVVAGGSTMRTFAVAVGNEPSGSKISRHVGVVDSVSFHA